MVPQGMRTMTTYTMAEYRKARADSIPTKPINRVAVTNLLIRAYGALRTVDATAIENERLPVLALDRVSDAISAIEEFCRERGIKIDSAA